MFSGLLFQAALAGEFKPIEFITVAYGIFGTEFKISHPAYGELFPVDAREGLGVMS